MDNLKIVFSEPKIVLMTINGSFNKHINLEMLCITIFQNKCIDLGITKFVGFNKIYFYNPIYTKHNDDNKYFYNQCSFDFIDKSTFKLFNNDIDIEQNINLLDPKRIDNYKDLANDIFTTLKNECIKQEFIDMYITGPYFTITDFINNTSSNGNTSTSSSIFFGMYQIISDELNINFNLYLYFRVKKTKVKLGKLNKLS